TSRGSGVSRATPPSASARKTAFRCSTGWTATTATRCPARSGRTSSCRSPTWSTSSSTPRPSVPARLFRGAELSGHVLGRTPRVQPALQALEVQEDHRGYVERQELGEHQSSDYRESKRHARAAARAESDRDRQAPHERGHSRHHDRAETDE